MAFELKIDMGRNRVGSIKLNRFDKGKKAAIRQGMVRVGALLEEQIVKNLSGPSHSRFPGNANPFPGVVTGQLKNSVRAKIVNSGLGVIVGPGSEADAYAAIQEFGGNAGRGGASQIPPRPYVRPAWEKRKDEVVDTVATALFSLVQ